MKNKKFTVSTTNLDTHAIQIIDTYLDLQSSTSGTVETRRNYPNKVQFINKTGQDILANIFSSQGEYDDYVLDSTNYDMFTILNNTAVSLTTQSLLPTAYKIAVVSPSGTCSVALTIDCIGYQPKGF